MTLIPCQVKSDIYIYIAFFPDTWHFRDRTRLVGLGSVFLSTAWYFSELVTQTSGPVNTAEKLLKNSVNYDVLLHVKTITIVNLHYEMRKKIVTT